MKSIKAAALFSFVIISNITVKTFFQGQQCFKDVATPKKIKKWKYLERIAGEIT